MRIISGKNKGKKLEFQSSNNTRPTTDRVKENIFNILQINFANLSVLDLFAGSGQFGLEAYSRGASNVVLCDNNNDAIKIIKQNCKSINANAKVINASYLDAIMALQGSKFDVVFLDPPYKSNYYISAVQQLVSSNMLASGAVVVCEMDKNNSVSFDEFDAEIEQKVYGNTKIVFLYF